jgi:beta-glucanase (GH16 family)
MIEKAMMTSGLFRKCSLLLLAAAGLLALASSAQAQLVWSDEFDSGSAPDASVWSYDLGGGGWGNSELQTYTDDPANVRVENGYLYITAVETLSTRGKRTTSTYTSARVKTQDKLTVKYGTVEARIMTPDLADGLWPAFWTLGNNFASVGWPNCGEIDIMEMGNVSAINDGVVNRRVGSTAHWEANNGYAGYGLTYDAPADLNGSFHIYRMEWTPTEISTYIDGVWIWTIDISDPASFDGEEFHEPHFIILNLAVGGSYTGITNSSGITAPFPADYVIDYVRIYDNGFTVLGGSSIDGGGPGGGTSAHVDSITPGASGGGRKKKANAAIVIVDENGDPVSGATVTATFSGSHNQTVSGSTGSNGSVTLQTSVTSQSAAFTVCVDDVVSSLTYDAAANVETCDTF